MAQKFNFFVGCTCGEFAVVDYSNTQTILITFIQNRLSKWRTIMGSSRYKSELEEPQNSDMAQIEVRQ